MIRTIYLALVISFVSGTAFGKDGVRASIEPGTAYRSIEGTRSEGILAASMGFVAREKDHGMRLSIGPVADMKYGSAALLYAPGFMVPKTGGVAAYHEAEGLLRGGPFGLSAGYSWENKNNIHAPQGSGLGKRSFARFSVSWETK